MRAATSSGQRVRAQGRMQSQHRARAPRWYPDVAPCRIRDILPPIPSQLVVSRLRLFTALCATALAAWISQGTLAQASDGVSRIALLPVSIPSAVIVV